MELKGELDIWMMSLSQVKMQKNICKRRSFTCFPSLPPNSLIHLHFFHKRVKRISDEQICWERGVGGEGEIYYIYH